MSDETAYRDTFARDRLPPRELWPEFRFDLPELQYPTRMNCAAALLDEAVADGHGDRPAIFADSITMTYRDLLSEANRIARVLTEDLGLVPGNRVLLRSPNSPMLAASWFAVMKAGGIAVTTMPLLRAAELVQFARKAEISHALYDDRLAEDVAKAAAETGLLSMRLGFSELSASAMSRSDEFQNVDTLRDDVCLLAFTSGTTGQPKATMHFHRDVLAMADVVGRHLLQTQPGDRFVGSPPLGFTFGLGALLVFPLRFRAATILVETPKPESLLAAIGKFRATALFTAPTMYRTLMPMLDEHDISSLNRCISAGEALPASTSDAWHEKTGIRIIDGIGTTEMIHIFIGSSGDDIRSGATGKPLPAYQACVLDDENQPLPQGSTGRLAVKGPTGCRYMDDEERQRAYVVNGWNVTGDTYRHDEDGYFWFQARADDMIVSAGYNIAGPEVEDALLGHDAVAECAVVAAPDEARGNIVKAFVVLREGHDPTDALVKILQDFVKQTIAPYKYPRAVEFVGELPKTHTGKVQRFRLRDSGTPI